MPRQSRIDTPGALHHIITRGIERVIFDDDQDRHDFLERLGLILQETRTTCYAWALIPNHFHLLLRTGAIPVATVMRRLLTGHAQSYNRRAIIGAAISFKTNQFSVRKTRIFSNSSTTFT